MGSNFPTSDILATAAPEGNDTKTFLKIMLDAVREFRGEADQSDDITMLALKYLPSHPS